MSDSFGTAIKVTVFGESHGCAIGAVIDGIPAGLFIDELYISSQMEKRRARGAVSTARIEADAVRFLSGVYNTRATGSAICLIIENTNTKSSDYEKTEQLLRPGHADLTSFVKYKGFADQRGAGHFSGRLTAAVVAAGAICSLLLKSHGIEIATHISECAGVPDDKFSCDEKELLIQINKLNTLNFAVLNDSASALMNNEIIKTANEGDSVGGILETAIIGISASLGEPFFNSIESVLSHLLFSIPAVKGVEFGAGFSFAKMKGSEANDAFYMYNGKIKTKTNNNAGINGGISNGMPIILRTAVKPTPSIYKEQATVSLKNKENASLSIQGRHDPCIVHRARVVQDSMCAIALADLLAMSSARELLEDK